jgi:hypothetical protein
MDLLDKACSSAYPEWKNQAVWECCVRWKVGIRHSIEVPLFLGNHGSIGYNIIHEYPWTNQPRVYPVRSKNPWPKLVFLDGFGLADEQPLVGPTHPLQDKHRESIGIQFNFQQSLANWLGYGGLKLSLHIFTIFSVHVQGPTCWKMWPATRILRSLNPHPIRKSHPILCMAQLFLQQISRFPGAGDAGTGILGILGILDLWNLQCWCWNGDPGNGNGDILRGDFVVLTWFFQGRTWTCKRDLEWWISDGANECKSMKHVRCIFYTYTFIILYYSIIYIIYVEYIFIQQHPASSSS